MNIITNLSGSQIDEYIANKLSNTCDTDCSIKELWNKVIAYACYYNIEIIDTIYKRGLYYTVDNTSLQQHIFTCHNEIILIDTIRDILYKYSILGVKRIFIQNIYNESGITYVTWFKTNTILPELEMRICPAFYDDFGK